MKNRVTSVFLPSAVIIALLLLWEISVKINKTPLYVLPPPSAVVKALAVDYQSLISHSAVTLIETMAGMIIAVILGMTVAVVMDAFSKLKTAVFPILVVSQTIPIIVLAPILVIYLGFGAAPKVLTVVLMCFFPIAISFADGMSTADINHVNLLRTFGAGRAAVYRHVKIPAAMPALFSGMQVAATYSVAGAVVGEWLAADAGLGYYMLRLKNGYMLDKVFACVVMVVVLSLLMNGLVRLIKHIAVRYR